MAVVYILICQCIKLYYTFQNTIIIKYKNITSPFIYELKDRLHNVQYILTIILSKTPLRDSTL
jgi:hypothetical protein